MPISRIPGEGLDTGSSGVAPSNLSTGAPSWDGSGNLSFNSGYGSNGVAYGCRAWVNFQGNANTSLSGTYSQSGTTVTVTATAHGLIAGNVVYSDITTGTAVDGTYTVTAVTDANTFTYTAGTSLTTSGNITLVRSTIRASGNVSTVADNGTGQYTVNFTTAMPDANYCLVATGFVGNGRTTGIRALGTTTSAEVGFYDPVASAFNADSNIISVAIFR